MKKNLRLGVDIGGTDIKLGVVENKKIIQKLKIPTLYKDDVDKLINYIADECKKLTDKYSIEKVGVGVPGSVLGNTVARSANLPFENTPFADMLSEKLGLDVMIENDANCAALGEIITCNDSSIKNLIMITIGTGIGGGIIINNEIYRGKGNAGEIGHMIIEKGGKKCRCGKRGCVEQYISASALIAEATSAAVKNKNSLLYKLYKENEEQLDGKIFFEALNQGCEVTGKVFDNYTDYFAEVIECIIRIFSPDAIVITGGITKQRETLLNPIVKKVDMKKVDINISSLQSDAGIVGAAYILGGI